MPTDQTSGDTALDRIAELEAENKRLLAELGTAREMRPPTGMWQVAVTVPMSLPRETRYALFDAIASTADAWKPLADRDGWDIDVSGHPVPLPCPDARAHDVTAQAVARWALDQLGRCVDIFAYIVMDTEEDRARHAEVVSLFRRAKEAGEKRLAHSGEENHQGTASELRAMALKLRVRGQHRDQASDDATELCDGECAASDCHTVSAVATWDFAARILDRRADELQAGPAEEPR